MLGPVSFLFLALTAGGARAAPMQLEDSGHAATLSALVTEEQKNSGGSPPPACRNIVGLPEGAPASKRYVPVHTYEARRDAIRDVQNAVLEANRTGRNVLIQVGGEWCGWCRILDRVFEQHWQLVRLRDENFVTVAVNYSDKNRNKQLLSRLPRMCRAWPGILNFRCFAATILPI
jgi:thiol-disulfide isomerase/thioredoxin